MNRNISDVLQDANKIKKVDERAAFLKQNESFALRTVLQLNFHPNIVSALPEGAPPYQRVDENKNDYHRGYLHAEARKLGFIVENPDHNITQIKRENIFITLLETVPGPEADMLVAAKDKKLSKVYKNITEPVVRKAFPEILPVATGE